MANLGLAHDPDLNLDTDRNLKNIDRIMMRIQKMVNHHKIKGRIGKNLLVELQVLNNTIRATLKQEAVVNQRRVDVKKMEINLGLHLQNELYLLIFIYKLYIHFY